MTTTPVVRATPAVPVSAATEANASSGGGNVGQLLLIVGALGLLALSLVPSRIVVRAGLEPTRAGTVRVGLAVAGVSVGIGFLIALMLSKTA